MIRINCFENFRLQFFEYILNVRKKDIKLIIIELYYIIKVN